MHSAEGFDPAWRGADRDVIDGAQIHKVYFDETTKDRLKKKPNVVLCRHTIEHVPDPVAFLKAIRKALGEDSKARLFLETPCADWIIQNNMMQDLFYEHCSIFTVDSMSRALSRSDFIPKEISYVFGGQYLWAEAEASSNVQSPSPSGSRRVDGAVARTGRFADLWREAVENARSRGPVAIWGAGAKGVTFAYLVDPEGNLFDHIVDINIAKQSLYLPGSGLQILSPQKSSERAPKTIFVMNSNYIHEIRSQAQDLGIDAEFIPID